MLARLEALDGVDRAEVDRGGQLLRLSVRDGHVLGASIALLDELGHEATPVENARDTAWYDARSVGELSRAEAGAIADRIVPAFADQHGLPADRVSVLRASVVDALYRCFVTHALGGDADAGAFRLACVRAVEDGTGTSIGPGPARDLARRLDQDLGGVLS